MHPQAEHPRSHGHLIFELQAFFKTVADLLLKLTQAGLFRGLAPIDLPLHEPKFIALKTTGVFSAHEEMFPVKRHGQDGAVAADELFVSLLHPVVKTQIELLDRKKARHFMNAACQHLRHLFLQFFEFIEFHACPSAWLDIISPIIFPL